MCDDGCAGGRGAACQRALPEPPLTRAQCRAWLLLHLPASFLRLTEQLLELLTTEILHPDSQAPNGVKSHFIEIFLEELARVGADEVRGGGLAPPLGPVDEGLTQPCLPCS